MYPVPGQATCAAGGPASAVGDGDARSLLRRQLRTLCHQEPAVAAAIDEMDEPHPWPMTDRRRQRWFDHRVALRGDAAVVFVPTAGVGASVAMRATAGLADELSRAGPGHRAAGL